MTLPPRLPAGSRPRWAPLFPARDGAEPASCAQSPSSRPGCRARGPPAAQGRGSRRTPGRLVTRPAKSRNDSGGTRRLLGGIRRALAFPESEPGCLRRSVGRACLGVGAQGGSGGPLASPADLHRPGTREGGRTGGTRRGERGSAGSLAVKGGWSLCPERAAGPLQRPEEIAFGKRGGRNAALQESGCRERNS